MYRLLIYNTTSVFNDKSRDYEEKRSHVTESDSDKLDVQSCHPSHINTNMMRKIT